MAVSAVYFYFMTSGEVALRASTMTPATRRLGAVILPEGACEFRVWAPEAREVEVRLTDGGRVEPMLPRGDGYFGARLSGVRPGAPYLLRLNREVERPDPASRLQADGVHGPSRVVDLAYPWQDTAWRGVPLWDYVIYELHVGTFSKSGTFEGVIAELARLRDLGVTAIELMPVAQFPGARNWGYDGVFPFAVQSSYGGPRALQRLVDECHRAGIAVVLDVVYNHLGPEGNHLAEFGPYFTDAYKTPWGSAINFDGPDSEGVRRYFIENALQWIEDFHIDALRLDAVHAIIDRSARPFLEELAEVLHRRGEELGRHVYLIAESDLNDPRMVRSSELGGNGLDAMWCDDFHHAAHVLLTGEQSGYYSDFGRVEHLARAWRSAMSSPGEFSPFRKRRHGRAGPDLRPEQCVVCLQNHDQIGNRMRGERLGELVGLEQQKVAAGLVCLSAFVPLLFMGEEYGDPAPFQYFIDHGDPELVEAVRRGRREEFAAFGWMENAPDPAGPETLERCVLNHALRSNPKHAALHALYKRLLEVRRSLSATQWDETIAFEAERVMFVRRDTRAWLAFCLGERAAELTLPVPLGHWRKLLSSADTGWGGPGDAAPASVESDGNIRMLLQPYSFVAYADPALSEVEHS